MESFSNEVTLIGLSLVIFVASRKLAYIKVAANRPAANPRNNLVPIIVLKILVKPTPSNQSQSVYNITNPGKINSTARKTA